MAFEANIIADSVSQIGIRLTTFQLKYPRFIHSELMTHRVFSRNAASSRAIPVAKMIEQVRNDPALPVFWGKNQAGMQSREPLTGEELDKVKKWWYTASESAADTAEQLTKLGLHKQVANRILEPWQWMQTIVTATEYKNFFELRVHPDAQPEFQYLASMMKDAYEEATPKPLKFGEWHLPYIQDEERNFWRLEDLLKFSTARCARVSYLTHDKENPDPQKDQELHDKLVVSKPEHASPTEHQATPMRDNGYYKNFRGWYQYRHYREDLIA